MTLIIRQHFKRFDIVRANKPTKSSSWYWRNDIGVRVNDSLHIDVNTNVNIMFSRSYGVKRVVKKTDNVDVIGSYKTGDIIKSRSSYIRIKYLEVITGYSSSSNNIFIVGEDLGSGLERRYPLTMRSMKTYTLSERIQKRLAKEKNLYLERKKNWDKDFAEMSKKKHSRPTTMRHISPLGRFQAVRKK